MTNTTSLAVVAYNKRGGILVREINHFIYKWNFLHINVKMSFTKDQMPFSNLIIDYKDYKDMTYMQNASIT